MGAPILSSYRSAEARVKQHRWLKPQPARSLSAAPCVQRVRAPALARSCFARAELPRAASHRRLPPPQRDGGGFKRRQRACGRESVSRDAIRFYLQHLARRLLGHNLCTVHSNCNPTQIRGLVRWLRIALSPISVIDC